jgi:hypothetical protein
MTGEREHALLSASGSHKWLHCPPSARLEDTLPETTSQYAEEGRLAHALCELKLQKQYCKPMGPKKYKDALKVIQDDPLYQAEMNTHAETYYHHGQKVIHGFNSPPYEALEGSLEYSHNAPEGFGTGDCVIIGDNTLVIIDYKYGKGVPVSAFENPQMMLYALGAIRQYSLLYDIRAVKMMIEQPRLDSFTEYVLPVEHLIAWGESIKPIAQTAFDGKGEFLPGEHCRFCRAKGLCRARMDFNMPLEEYNLAKPPLITLDEVGQILKRARNLKAWVTDLERLALSACLAGENVPGWKAVEGRSTRTFTDTDAAFKWITDNGYDEAVLYERKPITLTAVETLLGKRPFKELMSEYVTKTPGTPTLVPESDKREAITSKTTAAEDFAETNE